jgi:hypothetical protein
MKYLIIYFLFTSIAVKKIKDAQITKQAALAVANQKARNAGKLRLILIK